MAYYQYHHLTSVYFDTGIIPTINTRIEVDNACFVSHNGQSWPGLLGSEGPSSEWGNASFSIVSQQSTAEFMCRVGNASIESGLDYTYGVLHNLALDRYGFTIDGVTHSLTTSSMGTANCSIILGGRNYSGTAIRLGDVNIGNVRVYEGGVLVLEWKPTQYNGEYTYYDTVSGTYATKYGSGTVEPGPLATVFEPSQDTFTFNANGGTQTFTVTADNAWTCVAPTDFTISPMSGTAGTTTVTITAPRRISTISETITFTDAQSNTFDISVSQSVGTESPNLTLYQGSTTIKKMYQGTDLIYRKLAVSPTLTISGDTFNFPPTSYTAATVVVTTDANWSYSTEASWLQLTKTGNNLEIVPTSDWDQGSAPRTATVTVTADNGFITKSAEISVKQSNTNVTNVDWVWVENYGTDTGLYFDTGIYPTVNTSFRVKYIPIRPIGSTIVGFGPAGSGSTPTGSTSDNNDYRFFSAQNIGYAYWDFNSSRQNWSMLTTDADGYITAECGNNYVTDVNSGVTHTASAQTSIATTGVPIYLNLSNDLKVQSLEIFENGVKVYDGHAAFDGTSYGWNESISGTFTTQTYGGYSLTGAPVPDLTDYLCFTAEQANSTVGMMNYRTDASIDTPVLYYSRDKVMWVQWDYSPITLSNVGDKVYFYGNDGRISRNSSNYSSFQMSGRIAASGDVTTLITRNGTTQLTHNYCFIHLFDGCTSLTTAPELPATTFGQFASNCYDSMFQGCTSLTTAPALPATTLPHQCYIAMFQGCTSLTTAPELPATTLIGKCYQSMFAGCTSLVTAPELPATTIANGCYQSMFEGCTALTTAPELPATTLDVASYMYMFRGCTSLNTVKCLAEDISAQICTYQWLDGVSATGTFTKSANMNDWTSGINGIPSGWTVVDA